MPENPQSIQNQELVDRCCQGSESAWSELVSKYGPLVYEVASNGLKRHRIKDTNTIEDVVSEVFMEILKDDCRFLKKYDNTYPLKAWLVPLTIQKIRRHLRDHVKKRTPFEIAKQVSSLMNETFDMERSPLEKLEAAEQQSLVNKAIEKLPAKEKIIIQAHYFEGIKTPNIAKMLNIPLSSTGQALSRARKKLADILKKN